MPTPDIRLRPALQSDIDLLVEFNRAHAAEVEDKGLNPEVLRKGISHLMAEPRDGFYLIAETLTLPGRTARQTGQQTSQQTTDESSQRFEPAGILMVTKEWSDWRNAHFWWIQSVYVHPGHRRKGLYSALHNEVARQAREANACGLRLYVEKNNLNAQATYRSHGMEATYYLMFEDDWS